MFMADADQSKLINAVADQIGKEENTKYIMETFKNPTAHPERIYEALDKCGKISSANFDYISSVSIVMCTFTLVKQYTKGFPPFYI